MNDFFDQQVRSDETDETTGPELTEPEAAIPEALATDDGTAPSIKAAVQELLKYGLVEHAAKPNIYRTLQQEHAAVTAILEPLDLQVRVDDVRGLIFLGIAGCVAGDSDEAWQHPLLRRLRLTTEQSLLVAILRHYFIAHEQASGIGAEGARVDFEDLQAQFDLYLGETGSEQRNQTRLSNVLDQLYKHGIVSPPDKENQIQIRPIIVHLANPDQLMLLLAHFKTLAAAHPSDAEPIESPEVNTDTDV